MQGLDIYDDAELYDLLAPPNPVVADFYYEEARRLGGSVLELACGTGRFAIPLARNKLAVTGIDRHAGILARARAAAQSSGTTVTLIEADMRDFALEERFGLIFIAFNSFLHLHDAADIRSCLSAVARHLAPGGQFILDIFNPNPHWIALPIGERRKVGSFSHPALGPVTVEQTLDYDIASQVNRETWFWSTVDERDFRVRPLHLRNIYPQELPLLLELSGLKLVKRYGAYDRRPFDSKSPNQLCVCEKAG